MADLFAQARAFRAGRDAWWSARSTGGSRIAAAARGRENAWKLSGEHYLRAYKGLDGQLVRWPAELLDLVETQIGAMAPRLARAFDHRLGSLVFDAWRRWPVSTGLSKSLLDIEYEQRGETFLGRVVSRAPYSTFIKSRSGRVVQELIKKPGALVAGQIGADLEADNGR